ncbi:MAG: hypothetical protein R3F62_07770 [Planctomycetota bacterium]
MLQLLGAARAGDRQAVHGLLHALKRAGPASPSVELAAYLLEPDAGAFGPAAFLPRASTVPGAPFEPVEAARTMRHGLELTWRDPRRGSAWAELDARYAGIPRDGLKHLLDAIVQFGVRHLILDLRGVHGLTSGGMADLSRLKQRLEVDGGTLGLLMAERVSVVTQLLGLSEFLGLHEDPDTAAAQLDAADELPPATRGSARWLAGTLRWGADRAGQAALCLAAHAEGTSLARAAFERVCARPDAALPPPPAHPRAREFWTSAERLRSAGCWAEPVPELSPDELGALVETWVPRLLSAGE